MFLSDSLFKQVMAFTPLVSIDLVVRDSRGRVLLGKRKNRPARNTWFVPGGRILKNECLDDAFWRLTQQELGLPTKRKDARLLDVYEHFYADSVFGDEVDTHYVVLGYLIDWPDIDVQDCPQEQHEAYHWFTLEEAQASPEVHSHTKNYFTTLTRLR